IRPPRRRPAALELRQRSPRAERRLLQCVLRVVNRAEHPAAARLELGSVPLDELRVRGLVEPGLGPAAHSSATSSSPTAVFGRARARTAAARKRPITTGALCLNASVNGWLSSCEKNTVPTTATPSAPPSCWDVLNIPPAPPAISRGTAASTTLTTGMISTESPIPPITRPGTTDQ